MDSGSAHLATPYAPDLLPALALTGLGLAVAVAVLYRYAAIGRWRRYGMTGEVATGAALGGASTLMVLPLWLALAPLSELGAAIAFEASLLPPLTAMSLGAVTGFSAAGTALVLMLAVTVGAAWPAALLFVLVVLAGYLVIRQDLVPLSRWIDWRWLRKGGSADALDAGEPSDWQKSIIGM